MSQTKLLNPLGDKNIFCSKESILGRLREGDDHQKDLESLEAWNFQPHPLILGRGEEMDIEFMTDHDYVMEPL